MFQVRFSHCLHAIRGQFAALHEREDVRRKTIFHHIPEGLQGTWKLLENDVTDLEASDSWHQLEEPEL